VVGVADVRLWKALGVIGLGTGADIWLGVTGGLLVWSERKPADSIGGRVGASSSLFSGDWCCFFASSFRNFSPLMNL
jgi:hypothetical protein